MDKQAILKQIIEEQLKGKQIELGNVDPEALANTIMEEAKAMATPLIQANLNNLKIKKANEDEILEAATEIFVNAINKSIDKEIEKLKTNNESLKNLDLWEYMAKKFAKPTEKVVEIVDVPTAKKVLETPKGVFQVVAKDGYNPEEDENEEIIDENEAPRTAPKFEFKPRVWGRGQEEFGNFRMSVPTSLDQLDWEAMAKRFADKVEKTLYKGMNRLDMTAQIREFHHELEERNMLVKGTKCQAFFKEKIREFDEKLENWPEEDTQAEEVKEVEVVEERKPVVNSPQEALKKLDEIMGTKHSSEMDFSSLNMDDHTDDIVITIGDNPSEIPVITIPKKEQVKTEEKINEQKCSFNFLDFIK